MPDQPPGSSRVYRDVARHSPDDFQGLLETAWKGRARADFPGGVGRKRVPDLMHRQLLSNVLATVIAF